MTLSVDGKDTGLAGRTAILDTGASRYSIAHPRTC